jgi:hypothetical protein
LSAEGDQAEALDADLGRRGLWRQVIVGRYDTVDEADADLAAIRERPSDEDARVVVISAW